MDIKQKFFIRSEAIRNNAKTLIDQLPLPEVVGKKRQASRNANGYFQPVTV